MARNFPATGTSDYLTIAASTDFDFQDNVNILAVVKPSALGANDVMCAWGDALAGGFGISLINSNGDFNFIKVDVADVTGTVTTRLVTGQWQAILANSGNAADAIFKRLRMDTDDLATETTADSNSLKIPSNDPGRIGQWLSLTDGLSFPGDIHRVVLYQGTILTDDEFRSWAYTGRINRTLLVDVMLYGGSPEADWSGNGNNPTVTGTTIVDAAPVAPPFGFDLGWQGAFAAAAPGGLSIPVAMASYRRRHEMKV